jgi:7-carboxy-7-deazaguanine synthase
MAEYKVVEIFTSINGEGQRAGQPAVFVRFQGCNLACSFCDTMWANRHDTPYRLLSGEEIMAHILSTGIRNVTLTGGEPLLQEHIGELLSLLLKEDSLSVEIETNGSVSLEPFLAFRRRPLFTLDYKLAGSGMEAFMNTDNYRFLTKNDTVKFVCSDRKDLERSKEIIDKFHLTGYCRVYFSPVFGRIDPQEIVSFLLEHKMNGVTLQLQIHKIIWPPDMRGV